MKTTICYMTIFYDHDLFANVCLLQNSCLVSPVRPGIMPGVAYARLCLLAGLCPARPSVSPGSQLIVRAPSLAAWQPLINNTFNIQHSEWSREKPGSVRYCVQPPGVQVLSASARPGVRGGRQMRSLPDSPGPVCLSLVSHSFVIQILTRTELEHGRRPEPRRDFKSSPRLEISFWETLQPRRQSDTSWRALLPSHDSDHKRVNHTLSKSLSWIFSVWRGLEVILLWDTIIDIPPPSIKTRSWQWGCLRVTPVSASIAPCCNLDSITHHQIQSPPVS